MFKKLFTYFQKNENEIWFVVFLRKTQREILRKLEEEVKEKLESKKINFACTYLERKFDLNLRNKLRKLEKWLKIQVKFEGNVRKI